MMDFSETRLLQGKLSHWIAIAQSRGRSLRFLREVIQSWWCWTKKQKRLHTQEKEARGAIRACRIKNALELCSLVLAKSSLSKAINVGKFMQCKQHVHVPISKRVDQFLDSFRLERESEIAESAEKKGDEDETNPLAPVGQNSLLNRTTTLTNFEWGEIDAMKEIHFLLSQISIHGKRPETDENPFLGVQSIPTKSSFIDMLRCFFKRIGASDCQVSLDNPSALPHVHMLDLIALASAVHQTMDGFKKSNPEVDIFLRQQHYISTGSEDSSPHLFHPASKATHSIFHSADDILVPKGNDNANTFPTSTDFIDELDFHLFEGKNNVLAEDLKKIRDFNNGSIIISRTEDPNAPNSLVDSIATSANTNLSVMKLDVGKSLHDVKSSQINFSNYNEFIEKKKQQRIQCLHDIKAHCCTCRGPHISKPPFSHGKDYRRDPTHEQSHGRKCLFLKKKKEELQWLDETLDKFANNCKRFERTIQKCQATTEKRKEEMKDALANSLRLMDMALP